MAGELVEVFGQSAWFACGECPAQFKGKKFSLRSSDGEQVEVEAEALCAAKNIFKLVKEEGETADIQVPFKKALLAKVAEYLAYHQGTPPSEIRTPLESDNLIECGALKWDAAFINVDKELLFELLVAGITMGIPSLTFLAGARASLLIKGKTPDKLVKDFKMSNDLPAEEEETLSATFTAQKEKVKANPDESGLGGVALILNSIFQAAEKNDILAPSSGEAPGPSKVSLKSFRHASWRAMVLSDWTQLGAAPPEVQEDRDLFFAAVGLSRGAAIQLAPDGLRADRALVLEAVKYSGEYLGEAASALRGDRGFVSEAIAVNGTALAGASDQLKGDRDFVLSSVKTSGSALKGAAANLRADKAFVLQCVMASPQAFKYAADELKADTDFALHVASCCGAALQYMPFKYQADRAIVSAAVESDPSAMAFAHTSARMEMKAPMPWDSEPLLAAQCKAEKFAPTGRADADAGPRLMGVPLSKEAAKDCSIVFYQHKTQKMVQFSALSVMTANMGQANYIAANSYLDKMPFFERPECDSVTLMWGAVGNIGMRWKAFASQDMLNANPEALMSVMDAAKVLLVTAARMDAPEWYAASFFDEWTRQSMLQQTAGVHSGGGFRPGENAAVVVAAAAPRATRGAQDSPAVEKGGPLGGWPGLSNWPEEVAEQVAAAKPAPELAEGVRVALTGLQAKSGTLGTVLKRCPDGRWKVKMDDGSGISLLNDCYLLAVSPPTSQGGDAKGDAAARRLKAMEERKARLMAKAEAQ